MKRFIGATIFLSLIISLKAQVPQGISHQAVIRDATNALITNAPVGIRVSIIKDVPEGAVVYSELHTPVSNANGLISFIIGEGNGQTGSFTGIDWSTGTYYIKTEADPLGGTSYTITGTSRLLSVPYALCAKSAAFVCDSLVLKDTLGVTRFVLNPNTGMFKMMDKDTVWYSIAVNSPANTGIRYSDGSYRETNGNVSTLYSDESKVIMVSQTTHNNLPGPGIESEIEKQFDAYGNLRELITRTKEGGDTGTIIEEQRSFNENGNEIKKRRRKYNMFQQIIQEEYYDGQSLLSKKENTYNTTVSSSGVINEAITDKYEGGDDKNVITQSKTNGVLTDEKRYQKNTSSGGLATLREWLKIYYDDNTVQKIMEYYSPLGAKKFIRTETADKEYQSYTQKVEDNSGNYTYILQDYYGIHVKANVTKFSSNLIFGGTSDFSESPLFRKDVNLNKDINVKGIKKFRIDHPQYPSTKYLQHAAVESNEVMNFYSGNVTTGTDSLSTVTLPDYFNLINIDFRYQLTVIGTGFVRAIVFSEIDENNEFQIKTDAPGIKVSWQVTARRNDQYMLDNPFSDVVDK
ncbi:MAG: hypothetical protein EOM90_15205 [Alphaproteobacteria bacterium]|nr:hypothetical protein [Alphaproteobacteria bacterium]